MFKCDGEVIKGCGEALKGLCACNNERWVKIKGNVEALKGDVEAVTNDGKALKGDGEGL